MQQFFYSQFLWGASPFRFFKRLNRRNGRFRDERGVFRHGKDNVHKTERGRTHAEECLMEGIEKQWDNKGKKGVNKGKMGFLEGFGIAEELFISHCRQDVYEGIAGRGSIVNNNELQRWRVRRCLPGRSEQGRMLKRWKCKVKSWKVSSHWSWAAAPRHWAVGIGRVESGCLHLTQKINTRAAGPVRQTGMRPSKTGASGFSGGFLPRIW